MRPPTWGPPPWAWMYGPPNWQGDAGPQPSPDIILPVRVVKAMEFVALMGQKTMTRAAVSESQVQTIEGQELTSEEDTCLATACNMLSHYFAGKLTMDAWEAMRAESIHQQAIRNGLMGKLLYCIACAPGPVNPDCELCEGTGRILVTSIGNKIQQPPGTHQGQVPEVKPQEETAGDSDQGPPTEPPNYPDSPDDWA